MKCNAQDAKASVFVGLVVGTMLFGGLVLAAKVAFAAAAPSCAGSPGFYSEAQAARGAKVFDTHCSSCHGAKLQGKAGPPLTGKQFESYLNYSKISASQFFDFITSQMPYNDPGSLSQGQYLAALAHIFHTDGYPGGDQPLSEARLKCLKLLPYPGSGNGH